METDIDKIEKNLNDLPEEIRGAVLSADTADMMNEIAKIYKIEKEKKENLFGEIHLLLIGAVTGEEFMRDLIATLPTSKNIA